MLPLQFKTILLLLILNGLYSVSCSNHNSPAPKDQNAEPVPESPLPENAQSTEATHNDDAPAEYIGPVTALDNPSPKTTSEPSSAPKSPLEKVDLIFEFEKLKTESLDPSRYRLRYNGEDVTMEESPDHGLLVTTDPLKRVPNDLLWTIRSLHLLTEKYPESIDLKELKERILGHHPNLDLMDFIQLIHKTCRDQINHGCMDDVYTLTRDTMINNITNGEQIASWDQLLWNVGLDQILFSETWNTTFTHLQNAIENYPQNPTIRKLSFEFSLEMGIQVLNFYENMVTEKGLAKAISFSSAEDGDFTYGDALLETTANTYNLVRLITSKYLNDSFSDDIISDWNLVLNRLRQIRMQLNLTLETVKNLENPSLDGLDKTLESNLDTEFFASPFIQSLLDHGIYPATAIGDNSVSFPIIDSFAIANIDRFTHPKFWQVFKEQINFLNVYMLVRGPAILRSFGRTSFGIKTIESLHLKPLVNSFSKLPAPLDRLAIFLALETADGCIVRYVYVGITGMQKLSSQEKFAIEAQLKNHMF